MELVEAKGVRCDGQHKAVQWVVDVQKELCSYVGSAMISVMIAVRGRG
jgi:hypothetical protein